MIGRVSAAGTSAASKVVSNSAAERGPVRPQAAFFHQTLAGCFAKTRGHHRVPSLVAHSIQAPGGAEDVLRPEAIQRTIETGGSLDPT